MGESRSVGRQRLGHNRPRRAGSQPRSSAASSFPLTGRHTSAACTQCHTNSVYKRTPAGCATCHNAPSSHPGFYGSDCRMCHSTSDWSVRYSGGHTFPLNHHGAGSVCTTCHTDSFRATPATTVTIRAARSGSMKTSATYPTAPPVSRRGIIDRNQQAKGYPTALAAGSGLRVIHPSTGVWAICATGARTTMMRGSLQPIISISSRTVPYCHWSRRGLWGGCGWGWCGRGTLS